MMGAKLTDVTSIIFFDLEILIRKRGLEKKTLYHEPKLLIWEKRTVEETISTSMIFFSRPTLTFGHLISSIE